MSPEPRTDGPIHLRHAFWPNLLAAGASVAVALLFVWRWWAGTPGSENLVLPAVLVFGLFGLDRAMRALDRRAVAILDADGLLLPATMSRPLPWSAVEDVAERRFGRKRLYLYVADTTPYLRASAQSDWNVKAMIGKLRPGFARPAIELDTTWLDRGHVAIREVTSTLWGAARGRAERA